MPRIRHVQRVARTVIVMFLALAGASSVWGRCPFCGPTAPPFSERRENDDVIVVAGWKELRSDKELRTESTAFEIVKVLKGDGTVAGKTTVAKGKSFSIPFGRDGKPGETMLMFGKVSDDELGWDQPVPANEIVLAYFSQLPPLDKPGRLAFFLNSLEYSDPVIADDAYAEFAKAPYADVAALAPHLAKKKEKLRSWIEKTLSTLEPTDDDPEEKARLQRQRQALEIRRGLYGLMLGLCGDPNDAKFLRKMVIGQPDPGRPRLGVDGMMAGYLLLAGEKGLTDLVDNKLAAPAGTAAEQQQVDDELRLVRNAILFLLDSARGRIPDDSLKRGLRKFLDRPSIAETVLEDLARWKDWDALEQLVGMYGRDPFDGDFAKRKIVGFVLACERDGKKNQQGEQPLPATATAARKFLDTLDATFVKDVEKNLNVLRVTPGKKEDRE